MTIALASMNAFIVLTCIAVCVSERSLFGGAAVVCLGIIARAVGGEQRASGAASLPSGGRSPVLDKTHTLRLLISLVFARRLLCPLKMHSR
jgi:hypothetical protein